VYCVTTGIKLVLASASPRRLELLGRIGLQFDVAPAHIDESLLPGENAAQAAQRLAKLKAAAVAASHAGAAVLAADTLVALDDMILGKPDDAVQAKKMLGLLSGREHRVVTGFCLRGEAWEELGLAETKVRFRSLAPAEIASYVASGEPLDKAGAYAVQGRGASLVEWVSGSYTNVVGLPLAACVTLMMRRGIIRPASQPAPELN